MRITAVTVIANIKKAKRGSLFLLQINTFEWTMESKFSVPNNSSVNITGNQAVSLRLFRSASMKRIENCPLVHVVLIYLKRN